MDPNEGYNWSSYLENKFWNFGLFCIKWTMYQREIKEIKRQQKKKAMEEKVEEGK